MKIDLGGGVRIELRRVDGELHGVVYWHECFGKTRANWIAIHPWSHTGWDLLCEDPLTLHPSIRCRLCGHEGEIRDGRWIPAPK